MQQLSSASLPAAQLEVLNTLERNDPEGRWHCVSLREWFNYRGHVCMSFEKLGLSLYDFLRRNSYCPFHVNLVCFLPASWHGCMRQQPYSCPFHVNLVCFPSSWHGCTPTAPSMSNWCVLSTLLALGCVSQQRSPNSQRGAQILYASRVSISSEPNLSSGMLLHFSPVGAGGRAPSGMPCCSGFTTGSLQTCSRARTQKHWGMSTALRHDNGCAGALFWAAAAGERGVPA